MSVDLERELENRLRQRSTAAPVGDGWEAIHRRIDARRRSRQRRRLAGCGVAVVVTVVASLALVNGSDREVGVATRPPTPDGGAELPRLVLDLPGWEVDHASSGEAGGAPTAAPPLWLFTEPGRGFDGKVVYVSIADPTVPYGLGEENPAASRVDVRGRTAYLNVTPALVGPVGQMGWRMADGTSVYLTSSRLTEEELVAFARAVDVAPDRGLVLPMPALPAGLAFERSTGPEERDGRLHAEVSYRQGRRSAELRLQPGGEWQFDNLVRDRLVSASAARAVTLDGAPGVVSTYQGPGQSHAVMWRVEPGVVAEVRVDEVSADEAVAVARSVKEIDEGEWQDLLARFRSPSPSTADAAPIGPSPHEQARFELCTLRGAWLAGNAGEAGRAEVVSDVRALRARAAAQGLDRDSDIVVVLDDLLAAMQSGDPQAVRSIPGGGC